MTQTCRRCRRVNPEEAIYCWYDGTSLPGNDGAGVDSSALDVGTRPFGTPFFLPSGKTCKNYNELALACYQDPAGAITLLQKGYLELFLAGQGRSDLAGAARAAAARTADPALGLDEFLGQLPVKVLSPAQLRVEPAVLDMATVSPGEDRRVELVLRNEGMRLLYGSASCNDCRWLSLGDGPAQRRKVFQCTDQVVLPVCILGRHLGAFAKPQEAEIQLESSGGATSVIVRIFVPVKPFPEGVLTGALSPREMAEKMRKAPREAVGLLENGAIARWYQSNGWIYPVTGPSATGLAAVQQLFEALGLARAPRVHLSEDVINLSGAPGARVEHVVVAVTDEDRAAVAFGASDQPWLEVGQPIFRGRSASLPLTVASVPGRVGETHQARVTVTANGSQRLEATVRLTVAGTATTPPPRHRTPPPILRAPPTGPPTPPPSPLPEAERGSQQPLSPPLRFREGGEGAVALERQQLVSPPLHLGERLGGEVQSAPPESPGRMQLLWILLPAVLLILALLAVVLRDYFAPLPATRGETPRQKVDSVPRIAIHFHDVKRDDELEKLLLAGVEPTMRFGLVELYQGKEVGQGVNIRRLTFDQWGRTNNTCLLIDGDPKRLFGSPPGKWQEKATTKWDEDGKRHEGMRSTWVWDDRKIAATQLVELVRGDQSNLLDTCRVRYRIENHDNKPHNVAIRLLLDTFIGGNDGVPFTIPGESALCDTLKDLPRQAKDKKVPNFLQALEKPDLAHPGTVAHLRLKVDLPGRKEPLEPPVRVTLGAWPSEKLGVEDRAALGPSTIWNVPMLSMKSGKLNDSAIAIYWKEARLEPGADKVREVGFEYGLWNLARQSSRLAATVDGSFRPDGDLTVVAYVGKAGLEDSDETVTLELPAGYTLVAGTATQPVPKRPAGAASANLPVTWKVRAGPAGKHALTVRSSAGLSQAVRVQIKSTIFD
jgi:hypothetical protein